MRIGTSRMISEGLVRKGLGVGNIGKAISPFRTKLIPDRLDLPVGNRQRGNLPSAERERFGDEMGHRLEIAVVLILPVEGIVKTGPETVQRFLGGIDVDRGFLAHAEAAQIVEAHHVIAVRMREESRIQFGDPLAETLLPKIRPRVDDEFSLRRTHQDRGTKPLVLRIVGGAHLTITANHGNPDRGSRSQKSDPGSCRSH